MCDQATSFVHLSQLQRIQRGRRRSESFRTPNRFWGVKAIREPEMARFAFQVEDEPIAPWTHLDLTSPVGQAASGGKSLVLPGRICSFRRRSCCSSSRCYLPNKANIPLKTLTHSLTRSQLSLTAEPGPSSVSAFFLRDATIDSTLRCFSPRTFDFSFVTNRNSKQAKSSISSSSSPRVFCKALAVSQCFSSTSSSARGRTGVFLSSSCNLHFS